MHTVRLESRYGAADGLTPPIAAKIAECASKYKAHLSIVAGGRMTQIESLISVLSMDLRRGLPLTIVAEGADAEDAAEDMRRLIEG